MTRSDIAQPQVPNRGHNEYVDVATVRAHRRQPHALRDLALEPCLEKHLYGLPAVVGRHPLRRLVDQFGERGLGLGLGGKAALLDLAALPSGGIGAAVGHDRPRAVLELAGEASAAGVAARRALAPLVHAALHVASSVGADRLIASAAVRPGVPAFRSVLVFAASVVRSTSREQGTGKSAAAKILGGLLDPSPVPLRKAPRDPESWVTAAAGSWIVAVDNISTVPGWFSDALCLAVFAFRRAVVLTGIDPGAVRGDLADRLLVIDLEVIDETQRLLDAELDEVWREAHPRVLGALLDLAASVAGVLPSVRLDRSPRMADFARVLAAVDKVLGTAGFDRYAGRGPILANETLTADPFICAMAAQLDTDFEGPAAALLNKIEHGESRPPKGWPTHARAVTQLLKKQAPTMRRAGWRTDEGWDAHAKVASWTITPPGQEKGRAADPPDPHPRNPMGQASRPRFGDAGVAGPAGQESAPSLADHRAARASGLAQVARPTAGVVLPAPAPQAAARATNGSPVAEHGIGAGSPTCTVCGKPNLYHRDSIERGVCAGCIERAERSEVAS